MGALVGVLQDILQQNKINNNNNNKKKKTPTTHKALFLLFQHEVRKRTFQNWKWKTSFLTPFFSSALGILGQKRDRLENLPRIFLYEYYIEFGSTFITLSTVKCTSVSISDGWIKTQNLKEFRTTRRIRLDVLIALSTCSRRLNKHEDLRHPVQQLLTSPKAISKQHSRKQSY